MVLRKCASKGHVKRASAPLRINTFYVFERYVTVNRDAVVRFCRLSKARNIKSRDKVEVFVQVVNFPQLSKIMSSAV